MDLAQNIKLSRDLIKAVASGQYLQTNKSYEQIQHDQFVCGALFLWDFLNQQNRNKVKSESKEVIESESNDETK